MLDNTQPETNPYDLDYEEGLRMIATALKLQRKLKRLAERKIKNGEMNEAPESMVQEAADEAVKYEPIFWGHCATHNLSLLPILLVRSIGISGQPELADKLVKVMIGEKEP